MIEKTHPDIVITDIQDANLWSGLSKLSDILKSKKIDPKYRSSLLSR